MEEIQATPKKKKRKSTSNKIVGSKAKELAAMRIRGETIAAMTKVGEVCRETVFRSLKNPQSELRRQIEAQTKRLMDIVPEAVDLFRDTINDAKNSPVKSGCGLDIKEREANIRLRKVAIDTGDTVLKTVGILPGVSQSVHVQNLVVGTHESLSPIITKLLGIKEDMKDITPVVDPLFQVQDAEYKELPSGNV